MLSPVEIYMKNREEFYYTLLPRLPHAGVREALEQAVAPWQSTDFQPLPSFNGDVGNLNSLVLLDWLKKPGFGLSSGRTTVSLESALDRAQEVESTGILLFQTILNQGVKDHEALQAELDCRQTAFAALVKLEDSLRYHRLRLDH